MKERAIYTEATQCRDCYKCVRECPVKAIRIENSRAAIDHDLCIFCGRCVDVCPAGAKRVRSDLLHARELVRGQRPVYVSLAPSFPAFFQDEPKALVERFRALGVDGVSETAIGADMVARQEQEQLEELYGPRLSSACPVVVELVRKYHQPLLDNLSPLLSPMCAHALFLRKTYGKDIAVIFIGPCIAKKDEADTYPEIVDCVLTFDEAKEWLNETADAPEENDYPEPAAGRETTCDQETTGLDFLPGRAGMASLFPIDGGMANTIRRDTPMVSSLFISQSGIRVVQEALEHLRSDMSGVFCEFLACPNGCINGSGMREKQPVVESRMKILEYAKNGTGGLEPLTYPEPEGSELCRVYSCETAQEKLNPGLYLSEDDIETALVSLGKAGVEDRKNCGGCGYSTCGEFAVAYLCGKAEPEMCVTEMRKLAQRKANALIKTIPLGIVLLDQSLRIVECNSRFLELFCELPGEADEHVLSRAEGKRVGKFVSAEALFGEVLKTGKTREEIVQTDGRITRAYAFSVQEGRLVGAAFQDITEPAVKRDMIVRKAEEVIKKNLESVQQIAGLLGENAADTEIILNSLIDTFQPEIDVQERE